MAKRRYKLNQKRFKTMADQTQHLTELKETKRKLHNLFLILHGGTFEGKMAEAVFDSLKLVDSMYTQVDKDIKALEPVEAKVETSGTAPEPEAAVQA